MGDATRCSAPAQLGQQPEIACNQGFLLLPAPSLHLPLGCNCILRVREFLRPKQFNRTPLKSVAAISSGIMLCDAEIEAASRQTNIVAAIAAEQNIDLEDHVGQLSETIEQNL